VSLENFGGEHKRDGMANHEETSGSPLPGTEAETASTGLAVVADLLASVVQFANPSALRCSPQSRGSWSRRPAQGVKVQVTGWRPFKDGLDDVGCQRGQAQNFRHPTRLELQ
jgi:hypothetical protein